MRFGIAGFLPGSEKRIGMAKKLGYEFIESSLSALHDDFSQESIDAMAEQIKSIGMPCIAVNGMFPKRIALLGESADKGEIAEYLCSAFEKTQALGFDVCVLGSGRSRKVPDGYPIDRAYGEFAELLAETIIPVAERFCKNIVIEPLSYYITNVINTLPDAVRVVKAVANPRLSVLADFFHISYNREKLCEYSDMGKYINHVHIASFSNRFAFPRPFDGDDYREFFAFLRNSGYAAQNVSVEAQDITFSNDAEFTNTLSSSLGYMKMM